MYLVCSVEHAILHIYGTYTDVAVIDKKSAKQSNYLTLQMEMKFSATVPV